MGCNCKARYSGEDANWWASTLAAVTNPVQPTAAPSSWVVPALLAGMALLIFWGTLTRGKVPR